MKDLISGCFEIAGLSDPLTVERAEGLYETKDNTKAHNKEQDPWSVSVDGAIRVCLKGEDGHERIETVVDSPYMGFSPSEMTVHSFRVGGIDIGPTSFGKSSMSIPSLDMRPNSGKVVLDGTIEALVSSSADLQKMNAFLLRVLDIDTGHSTPSSPEPKDIFPFTMCLPEVKVNVSEPQAIILVKDITLQGSTAKCSAVQLTQADGTKASLVDVVAALTPSLYQAKISKVTDLHIPELLDLADPMTDLTLCLENGLLKINTDRVSVIGFWMDDKETKEPVESSISSEVSVDIPFPVHVRLGELTVKADKDRAGSVSIHPIDVLIARNGGAISIDSSCETNVRLETSDTDWLDCSVSDSSLAIGASGGYPLQSLICQGMQVKDSSFGVVSIGVPSLEMEQNSNEVRVDGTVNVAIESFELVDRVQGLFKEFIPVSTDPTSPIFLFRVALPKIIIQVLDSDLRVAVDAIRCQANIVHCKRIILNDSNGMSASCSAIQASIAGSMCVVNVEWIDALYLPGVLALEKPVYGASLTLNDQDVHVRLAAVEAMTLQSNTTEVQTRSNGDGIFAPPFPVKVSIQEVSVRPQSRDGDVIKLCKLQANAKSDDSESCSQRSGVDFTITAERAENKLMRLENVGLSGLVFDQKVRTVYRFRFSASNAVIAAGYSSLDWSSGVENKKTIIELPFSWIGALTAHVSYSGKGVATHDTVVIPTFQGSAQTTSDDIIQHIAGAVLSKFPSIISNTSVFGENILEMSGKSAGRMAMAASITGSAVGSVAGLAAVDGVKGAVASGKISRKASEGDDYRFGDFSRGLVHFVKQSSKAGAESRRGSSNRYVPGDFTVGASKSLAKYTSENKARLGAAGVSGVGMLVGSAVAGPVGFIAGGYIGSRMGERALSDKISQQGGPAESEGDLIDLNAETGSESRTNQEPSAPLEEIDLLDSPGVNTSTIYGQSPAPKNAANDEWDNIMGLSILRVSPASTTTYAAQSNVTTGGIQAPQQPTDADWVCLMGSSQSSVLTSGPPKAPHHDPNVTTIQAFLEPQVQMSGRYASSTNYESDATTPTPSHAQVPIEQRPPSSEYHFGDITKSIISRGKKKAGRDDSSGYKFGDFSRGLFGG